MFELIEHTADTGFRARGATLEELFANCALALTSVALFVEDVSPLAVYPIAASGEGHETLLVHWLNEVLFYLDGERVAMCRFQVDEIGHQRVTGQGWGEPRCPARHRAKLVVKGVTYHQLRIVQEPDGWWAQVILDI